MWLVWSLLLAPSPVISLGPSFVGEFQQLEVFDGTCWGDLRVVPSPDSLVQPSNHQHVIWVRIRGLNLLRFNREVSRDLATSSDLSLWALNKLKKSRIHFTQIRWLAPDYIEADVWVDHIHFATAVRRLAQSLKEINYGQD